MYLKVLKMESKNYLQDIQEIKQMMNQSSRFISLSGLSGVMAGIYCLIGAFFAYKTIYIDTATLVSYENLIISETAVIRLFLIATIVIVGSLSTAILLSIQKAKKTNEKVWNSTTKRLLINFFIPLATGGFFIIFLIEKDILNLVAPLTLVFYGLSCVNASKYTLGDVRYLGLTMIVLGLLSTWFLNYSLLFWALGFGVFHILYGGIMYFKYERKL